MTPETALLVAVKALVTQVEEAQHMTDYYTERGDAGLTQANRWAQVVLALAAVTR